MQNDCHGHLSLIAVRGVARWFVCKPKIQIWVNFGGPWNGKCCHNLWNTIWPFGTFYEHLGHFMTIWYILCSFGTLFPVLVSFTKEKSGIPVLDPFSKTFRIGKAIQRILLCTRHRAPSGQAILICLEFNSPTPSTSFWQAETKKCCMYCFSQSFHFSRQKQIGLFFRIHSIVIT
jgi:hypothetical protein